MFERRTLSSLNDYFIKYKDRREKGVYLYRINGYNDSVKDFLIKYYEEARRTGVVIEGRIPNPDGKQLSYYGEIMGTEFRLDMAFLEKSLKKWLPRMNDYQRKNLTAALYDTLMQMRTEGKNDNMLRNAYIKFMCWLYYKFERVVNLLGENTIPKILYEGTVSTYELKLITMLSKSGCDVVLLQYQGDNAYAAVDRGMAYSDRFDQVGLGAFPEGFSMKMLRKELEERSNIERLYGTPPKWMNCTNAWMEGSGLLDIVKPAAERGSDSRFFYNGFLRIWGVEDKLTYLNDLYQFYREFVQAKRNLVIAEQMLPPPANEEIAAVRRKNYENASQMAADISANIIYAADNELQKLMKKAFMDTMLAEAKSSGESLNRLVNKAVYMICWLRRYADKLFKNLRLPNTACFIYLGGCRNDNEALFLQLLSLLPVDVVVLVPNQNSQCCLSASNLYEIHYEDSLTVEKFPRDSNGMNMATAAYHAERDLDTMMYQDSGMYRNRQYQKAVSVTLQCIYEEIALLWEQEMRFRPNFNVTDSIVTLPVLFAKVSGVKEGRVPEYWSELKKLMTPDTIVIKGAPYIRREDSNPIKAYVAGFLKNGKLLRDKIKEHSCYAYGVLREEVQEHILDKLQMLIDSQVIEGTFQNGTEFTITATILNLNRDIVRLIQKFDFTQKNPKLIYINTSEGMISQEDSILTAFLNLVGFDVVFFVPTGYQCVEKYFAKKVMEEYQIGEYLYDLSIPNFDKISVNARRSWKERIFGRR